MTVSQTFPLHDLRDKIARVYEPVADARHTPGEFYSSPEIVAIEESDRPIIRLPLPVATVNAPTAALLFQFREVALAGRDTRVDHFEQPVFAWR